jgi:hypothetical protein
MSERDRSAKFLDCAVRVLGTAGSEGLLELARRARSLADIRELTQATIPAARGTRQRRAARAGSRS